MQQCCTSNTYIITNDSYLCQEKNLIIFLSFVIAITLYLLPNFSARRPITPKHFSLGSLILWRSIIMFFDCLIANLILFSIVRLLLPIGDFISHSSPLYLMSGVIQLFIAGINSTSSPVQDKIIATLSSCGCTSVFLGTMIRPIFFCRFFIHQTL